MAKSCKLSDLPLLSYFKVDLESPLYYRLERLAYKGSSDVWFDVTVFRVPNLYLVDHHYKTGSTVVFPCSSDGSVLKEVDGEEDYSDE